MLSPDRAFTMTDWAALPSLRFNVNGQREVFCLDYQAAQAHVVSKLGIDAASTTQSTVLKYFKSIDEESLKEFASTNFIWTCTAGAGDLLYMPAGFVIIEHVLNKDLCIGSRQSILPKGTDAPYEVLKAMAAKEEKADVKQFMDEGLKIVADAMK